MIRLGLKLQIFQFFFSVVVATTSIYYYMLECYTILISYKYNEKTIQFNFLYYYFIRSFRC